MGGNAGEGEAVRAVDAPDKVLKSGSSRGPVRYTYIHVVPMLFHFSSTRTSTRRFLEGGAVRMMGCSRVRTELSWAPRSGEKMAGSSRDHQCNCWNVILKSCSEVPSLKKRL